MKTQNNTEIGKRGEEIAAEFLKKQGVDIIEKNYHTKFGEIDLIGFDKSTIIFIEVKLRNNDNFGTPVEAITQTKLKRIYKSALWYISMHKNNYDYRYSLEELVFHIDIFPIADRDDILFNLGGIINHNLYFKSMDKQETRQLPRGKLLEKINETYGGYDEFYDLFKEKALTLKGSGYTFLVINKDNNIEIINVKNQDLPLLMGYIPLLNMDMWEHAYYLNYDDNNLLSLRFYYALLHVHGRNHFRFYGRDYALLYVFLHLNF